MKTYFDCIPCFFKQIIEVCRIMNLTNDKTKEILDKLALLIPEIEMTSSPPATAQVVYRMIKEQTGNPDPYKELKQKSNELASGIYPEIKKLVKNSENRLLKAVEIAIAGNIIDYGAMSDLNINKEIDLILSSEEDRIKNENTKYFEYEDFINSLKKTKVLLYLADNAGEIVFDKILIEEIKAAFPDIQIYCAVRGYPIINDCTISDAVIAGIDKLTTVISNGTDAPGTILKECSKEFLDIWNKSDLIISKGQGNFESLSEASGNIFFLFMVKCQVLAEEIGCNFRDVILCKNL